jgi:hypothetical protein
MVLEKRKKSAKYSLSSSMLSLRVKWDDRAG